VKKKTKFWAGLSGVVGLLLVVVINFTDFFGKQEILAALVQFAANAFVFFSWRNAYRESRGWLMSTVTFIGTAIPVFMASITLINVFLLPYFFG
jgi:lysylphosphatidylglycerol synthetase-like protein (DUF2156 family)